MPRVNSCLSFTLGCMQHAIYQLTDAFTLLSIKKTSLLCFEVDEECRVVIGVGYSNLNKKSISKELSRFLRVGKIWELLASSTKLWGALLWRNKSTGVQIGFPPPASGYFLHLPEMVD
jgi:hypothetical protein